jgi:hypothetical protein
VVQVHVPPLGIATKVGSSGGLGSVKKLFVLLLLVVGGLAAWRKVQARQADLDLWTEATTSDSY